MDSGKDIQLKNVIIQNDSNTNQMQELFEIMNPYYVLYIMIAILLLLPILRSISLVIPNDICEVVSKTRKTTSKSIFLTSTLKNITSYFHHISFRVKSNCLFNKEIIAFIKGSYSTQYKSINQSNIYQYEKIVALNRGNYMELFSVSQRYSESVITTFNFDIVDGTYRDFQFIWMYTNTINVIAHLVLRFTLQLSVFVCLIIFNKSIKKQNKKKPTRHQCFLRYSLSYFAMLQAPIYEILILYQNKFVRIGEFTNMLSHSFCYFSIGCMCWLKKFENSKYLNDSSIMQILFGIVMLFLINMCASGNLPFTSFFNGTVIKLSVFLFGFLTLILPLNTEPQKPELYTTFFHMLCFYIISIILLMEINVKTNSRQDVFSRLTEVLLFVILTFIHFPIEEIKYSYSTNFDSDTGLYDQFS